MKIIIHSSKHTLGKAAAAEAAEIVRRAIKERGAANIVVATGASQFEVLAALVKQPNIAWQKVTGFHLDEYIGLPITHPASFRLYLWQRFVSQLPIPLAAFHFIDAEINPQAECARLGRLIRKYPIDVALLGIGENGHLAFNDPPADFRTRQPYVVVQLDEACRRQQLGEGWFRSLATVPRRAVSMSIQQIVASRHIVCSVPDRRKAAAVRNCLAGPISPLSPASILQQHPRCTVHLDKHAAALLP